MKTLSTILISLFFISTFAQNIESQITELQTYIDNEDYMQALGFADKLIANKIKEGFQDNASKVYLLRGIAKYKLELETDAIVDLKVSQSLNGSNTITYYYIADIYYKISSYALALENIIYLLEKDPTNVDGLVVKSKCELEMGNTYAAKMSIQKALALKSSDGELYYIRAVINSQLGEDKLACKDIKIADKFGFESASDRIDSFCNSSK